MKHINFTSTILFLSLLIANGESSARTDKPAKNVQKKESVHARECLEISGTATVNGKPIKDINVKLYKGDHIVTEIHGTKKDKIFFVLEENADYTVCFSKPGYVDRLIKVDTHLSHTISVNPIFRLDFDLEMLPVNNSFDPYYLDFPVAIVSHNKSSDKFEYNMNYTANIKRGTGEITGKYTEVSFGN